ncbi:MAG: UDP-N-acetylmuramoyl-L-alanine--D-glutamate ligase [Defluviitaleaceae bacterium]|nr:UDP-N-acetylmuramoyl-L-alanine--D-glutamate ligase [Defluviitaleaceae bacterium]
MDFTNKKILVCGMGKSGISAAKLLKRRGADVTLQDLKENPDLGEDFDLRDYSTHFGSNPDDILQDFDLIIVSPGIPSDLPFFVKSRELDIDIIGEMELGYICCASPILAITGTNGKTTTTSILGEIMRAWRPDSKICGNIGIPICQIADNMPEGAMIVAEVSSFQLETIAAFRPKVSAVLNITPDHLNRHKTLENYIAIKERIFENQNPDDYTILNFDDPVCKDMANRAKGNIVSFSMTDDNCDVYCKGGVIYTNQNGHQESIIKTADLAIPGNHNIENAMAAVAMAVSIGVPTDVTAKALLDFRAVEHRIEFVREINGVCYYNDSKATNVDSAIKGILAMKRPILLIGGGRDKDQDFADWIAHFADCVKSIVCIGEAAEKIAQTCRAYNYTSVERANSLKDAVELCAAKAESGDCILLSPACASFDMFESYEQRGRVFKEFVMEL